ncbi:hypothetical protein EWW49_00360 [Pseudomonas syringae]|uniref:hypothetical protein n=1 Tax=Pseudomonas sp. MWU16-30316 TaxID=2878093 RepID=UPI001101D74C|nr:hypothetical protein [Pseudomonas sp. MWU16-30316]TFZ37802.1 hypothetical protein EWW49_00360 [Pseudomonas syringae]
MGNAADWVANKIVEGDDLELIGRPAADRLLVRAPGKDALQVAVIGVKDVITFDHLAPILQGADLPGFVLNIPSSALWRGDAMTAIHDAPAAFGSLGDLGKAARLEYPYLYREKQWVFFHDGISQHSNVKDVKYLYDRVFEAHRYNGDPLIIAMVDAYNMSAEDVRGALTRYKKFDVAVKTTSYGSITSAASQAAASFGAQALMYGDLLRRLGK